MRLRVALLLLAGCDAGGAYLYTGHAYDPSRDCLGSVLGLDVLEGTDPGASCNATCIAGKDQDGGVVVYISTMCGPAPYNADTTGSSPQCSGAFAAQIRGDYCLDGGGSTHPAEDAQADAQTDAAPD